MTSTITENGNRYAGIVAYLGSDGIVENCYSTGNITISGGNYIYDGGLVGYSEGTINNCYSSCTVSSSNNNLFAYAGGLVGCLDGGSVTNSFATGNVTAKGSNEVYSRNGGLLGHNNNGTVTNCYRSSTQTLTRYTTSNSSYCTDGEVIVMADYTSSELIELLAWSDTIWGTKKSLPILNN